jgi:hypothetical protein
LRLTDGRHANSMMPRSRAFATICRMPTRPGGRRSPRLRDYDYTTPGIYFVTFCTAHRNRRLSVVMGCEAHLTADGRCAVAVWLTLFRNLPEVRVLAGAVMPDHAREARTQPPRRSSD